MGQTSHHTACMRQRAVPPGTGRCQKGACTGGLHSAAEACGVPHTVQFMRKMRKVCFTENRTHCLMNQKCSNYLLDQNDLNTSKLSGNGFERVRYETHVPRYPGYCEYSEYPPIRGSKSPRPAGALASLGGSSATRPGSGNWNGSDERLSPVPEVSSKMGAPCPQGVGIPLQPKMPTRRRRTVHRLHND